jgi:TP901 family phage tail tape measure protein
MATTINANLRINTSAAYSDIDVFKSRINKSFSQPLGRISGDAAEFSKSLQAAAARVTAFGATTGSIYLVSKAISETARATIEVNKQLTELNTFLGESQSNLNNFSKSLFSIARNTGATFSDATEAAKEYARQGLSTQETLTRTNDALVLSRISGLNYAQSVNSITTALNGFSKEALTSTEIINKLIAVDTRFAVSSRDLSEALTRVGSAAEEAGLSSDQLVATITAAQQITGRGGAVIGNALKTIFTRVRRPEILDQLKQIGVVVNDQNGSLLNAIDILKNYTNVTKNLSQAEKSRTAELLGGVYQINQLQSVIRDLGSANSIYANSLKISIGATDEAIKKNAELNKSYTALIAETKTVALQAGADIGKSLFGPLISSGASLTKTILGFLSPESIEPEISKTGQKIGNTLSKEIGRGVLDTLGNALVFVGAPVAAVVAGVIGKRLKNFLSASVKTQIKEVTDPLGRVITGGSYSGEKEKEQINLQNQIADVIKKRNFIGQATVKGVYDEGQARREVLKEILAQNAQLEKQAKLASTIYSTVSKIKPTVTNLSQVNAFGVNQAAPRRDSRGRFIASGYIPAFGDAEKEVAMAKGYGAKNPKAQLIQATIKGKTQPVMVNNEEDVIPNFAGTGETAIIPRYRRMQDIPRMSEGYIPNFAKQRLGGGFFGEFFKLRGSLGRKDFFDPKSEITKSNVANEFVAGQELNQMIEAGALNPIFNSPAIYGSLSKSIKKSQIYKSIVPGKTGEKIAEGLDEYTGERKGFEKILNLMLGRGQFQIDMGGRMKALDLVGKPENVILNEKTESILSKISRRKYDKLLKSIDSKDFEEGEAQVDRIMSAIAKKGGQISLLDPGIFELSPGLAKKRAKGLSDLGYRDKFSFSGGFIPNFASSKFVQNIVDSYKASLTEKDPIRFNAAQKQEKYYNNVNSELKNLSASSGYNIEKLAYGLAALSGNTADSQARKALERIVNNKPYDDLVVIPNNVKKVKEMLTSSGSTEELKSILGKGAKTQNFAQSLLLLDKFSGFGNYKNPIGTPSVMDSWAIYVRNGGALKDKYDRGAVSASQKSKVFAQSKKGYNYYNKLVKEYGEAAEILGVPVRELQARTWGWARTQMGSRSRNDSFASGYVPNFSQSFEPNLNFLYGSGKDAVFFSPYDTLSSKFGGGPGYPEVTPGRSFASSSTGSMSTLNQNAMHIMSGGGQAFFSPVVNNKTLQSLLGNRMFLETLFKEYPKASRSKLIETIINNPQQRFKNKEIASASESIISGIQKKLGRNKGVNAAREVARSIADPRFFGPEYKNLSSSLITEIVSNQGSIVAPNSSHRLYDKAALGGASKMSNPIELTKIFEGLIEPDFLSGLRNSYIPIGRRFDMGDSFSKKIGLVSKGYIPNFALPADAVLRHYYKKAKKASRSNYKNWKGYGFWDSMGQYNENPMLVRGTRSPEIEELLKSGQFQSQWAELGGAKSGTKATWVTSNFETANLYANRKSRNMFVQSEQDKDLQRGSPMIAGLSKGLRNDKNVFRDTAQGDSGSNFGALNPILDSDVRAIFKYKLGKRGPVPLSLKEIKQMAGIVPEDLLQIASGYIPNFAGLSNAVSREKTMTGLPVSQIMAHFDKSGNPIAVTNKKDEPNGLKDVVPNFAPRVRVPKGAKGPKGATAAEASDLFGSFVNNFIYSGLFQSTLSTLADKELVSETVNEAVQAGLPIAIAGFQVAKSYKASDGQKPGVRALAAGIPAALGVAQAGLGLFNAKSVGEDLQRRRLEKESDRAAKEFKDLTEGTQELSDTLSKLNEAFKDATTSPEQLSNLSKRTSELTRNITKNNPALAASISSEPNIERKINLIEDARRNASQKQAVQQEIIQFKGLTKRSPEDLINLFSKQISLANDKLLQVSKQDLIPQNLDKILAEADLQPLADFFKLQKEEVKNKLVPAFIEAVKSEIDYNKINKENIKKIKSLRSEEIKARNEIEGQRVRRQASSEALRAGAEELKPFAGQFGARAAISFDADLQKTKESIAAITSFRTQISTKLIDKDLKLPSNVVDRLKGIETPGQEAGAVLTELSRSSDLNEKQKEALDELIAANTNQSKELQKIADISEINKNAQLRVLTIQEKLNYGGGIKTTTDAKSRIDSINAPIKGLLENRLGTMLGSERSQTSGMVNVLKSIKDLYPGLIENSKALGGVRDRLSNLRAGDLQRDLLRNASLLQSAGGYGDLPGLLRAKAFDSEGLKNLAATQAEAELSGGGTPQEGARYLADVIKNAVSSLNQRMVDDQTIKNLEEQTRLPVQKINEETEAARQKFLNSLTESVKKAFGENIQVQTVNIPNANVNINPSSAYQPGESSGAAQARASMTTMASGASGPRSKGFIPSFYNPLREAIQRESQYVPFSSIRINKSNKLINQNNPLGLGVTNTIDEPNGLASIGLASRGYVPNFASKSKILDKVLKNETLYGSKISKQAQRLAKKGQLWGLDYAASDPAKGDYVLYKIKPNGSLGERGMPNKGDTVLSHVAASKFLGGVKDLLPISKLAEPPKSQEASLAGGTILPTSSIDKIIRDVKKKGGSATDLQKAVEAFAKQNLSSSNFLIKTGVGGLSIQSKGVFGINSRPLDSSAYQTILNDYGRGKGKSSDFFIQEKAQLSGQHNESRVHVAIDGKGNVRLVKNGTIDKSTGGNLAKGSYRRAAERAALQAAEAFVKANPKLAKNQFLGLDVGAVAATEGKRLGLTTRSFSELGQKFNPIVFEINPTNRRGSQGGSGFVSAENAFSKSSPSVFNSILSRLGVKADNKLVQSNVLEALSKGVMGNDTLLGSVKNKIADTNIPFPSSFFGKVKGAFSSSSSKVKSLFQNAGAKISNLGNSVFGSVGSKFSQAGQGFSNLMGGVGKIRNGFKGFEPIFEDQAKGAKGNLKNAAGSAFSGGLAALGFFGNLEQARAYSMEDRTPEETLSYLAALSNIPAFAVGGTETIGNIINKAESIYKGTPNSTSKLKAGKFGAVSQGGLKAAAAFSTAAESIGEFRAGNYGLSSVKGAEAAAYAASIFEGAGKALPKGKGILGSLGNITPKALSQAGGKAFGIGSALGLGAEIATAKDNAIAEDYSDILFGKKDEYINPETGEVVGKGRSIMGAGFDVFGTAMTAMAGGPIGQGVAAFKIGYRAGNVIENKLGIGEKLGKIYEDKINKERAGEIAGAEARLKTKKEGFKDREAFAANIAKIEAETEKARQEIRSKGRKDISEVYKRAEADKEKNDKDRTSFLRKRIVGDIIKNEEANGLSTSKDRANYLMSQEAIYGKFKPEEFADKELYKSYKAYSKEKETTQAREQKFNSAVMNPEMAGSQTYRVDQFRAEAERQSAMLASVPKDALEEAMRRGVSVEQVMEERRKVNKSRGFVPNFSNAYNREKLDILRNPDYSGYRNAVPQPSKYYKNIVKNSAEIEVPAVEVYNRMGYFGATPKNPSEQYAILNPAQQAKLGYASGGFVPNFAAEQFAGAVSDAMQKALSPLIDKVGTSVSNSNVINVSDQRSYQTSTDQIAGIMEFLYSQFPKEMGRKMGPKLV